MQDDLPVEAAARVIYEAGLLHHWSGFNKPYDQLDEIGRSEFLGIIARALAAAKSATGKHKLHDEKPYPVALIEDRYSGVYSGGEWLAIAKADAIDKAGHLRIVNVFTGGPYGNDVEAAEFWADSPSWIAAGDTPNDAKLKLIEKMSRGPLHQTL
jgi:hypothetical protein